MRSLLLTAALLVALPAAAVNIEYVAVRDPDNPADVATNCVNDALDCGSVTYDYAIARYEVTNEEYAEFLRAVAVPNDPNGLYNAEMASTGIVPLLLVPTGLLIGYRAVAGQNRDPVVYVSFWDAMRFANWLHNGQPRGPQAAGTTEEGAYTLTPAGVTSNSVTRNAGALVFLPSENEWYKAAYYDPALDAGTGGYYEFPTGTEVPPACTTPNAVRGTANCDNVVGSVTPVGSYPGSPSPYGTFDQGGNVWEWNERISSGGRGYRGGYWRSDPSIALSAFSYGSEMGEFSTVGFRVARPVPEPAHALLVLTGGLVLVAARRQRRA